MLSLDCSEAGFIRIRASGVLEAVDYAEFESGLRNELERARVPVPLLLDLRGFRGWTIPGFLRDLAFDLRHRKAFSKIAVVGERSWHKWITHAAIPVFAAQLRYFRADEAGAAGRWLRASSHSSHSADPNV